VAPKPPNGHPTDQVQSRPSSVVSDQSRPFGSVGETQCKFKPLRGAVQGCPNPQTTEWGFCNKHAHRTVQGKKAKEEYERVVEEQRKIQLKELEEELENLSMGEEDETERRVIRPNRWGRFEEPETGIVFDPDTNLAKGVQGTDGKLLDLDDDAIQICVENGWEYIIKPKPKRKVAEAPVEEETPEEVEEVPEEDTAEDEEETEPEELLEEEAEEVEDEDD
jgi:hypothetical protein